MSHQDKILEFLNDLGIKGESGRLAAEAAQERIEAGIPPLKAFAQAVVASVRDLRRDSTKSGLTYQGEQLADMIYELLRWDSEEFDSLC